MSRCLKQLAEGKSRLSRHDPHGALHCFEQALKGCPPARRGELASILFYLGITLVRLGNKSGALRSWTAASGLAKRGSRARAMLRRFANGYGMVRQPTPELDDFHAFFAVQLDRYLKTKPSRRIGTFAERDMIWDLISEYWRELSTSGRLVGRGPDEKLSLFHRTKIVFPSIVAPDWGSPSVIPVNFARKQRSSADERCTCGSGLPYMTCCGRTHGADELLSGSF